MIISIVNNKGGVGKTTLTVNLAHALALQGKRVLVVDMDSQCNASSFLLSTDELTPEQTLLGIYEGQIQDITMCIYESKYKNVFCIPNTEGTSYIEEKLYAEKTTSERLLRKFIYEFSLKYFHYTLIDCPPNMGIFVKQSLITTDAVIVPVRAASTMSIGGLSKALRMITHVKKQQNQKIRFLKLVINKYCRTKASHQTFNSMRIAHPTRIFDTRIARTTKFEKAELENKTILDSDPTSKAALQISNLAREIIAITSPTNMQAD